MLAQTSRRLLRDVARQRTHTRIITWGTFGALRATRPTELFLEQLPPRDDGTPWDLVAVGAGLKHMAFLTAQGDIIFIGNNRHGQVGQPASEVMLSEVTPFVYDVGYTDDERPDCIACGCNYNLLYRRGTRHATVVGYNVYGQLGLGHKQVLDNSHGFAEWDPAAPWWSSEGEAIERIECGKNHTLIITTLGRVLACGSNQWGELGLGDNASPMTPRPSLHFIPYAQPAPPDADARCPPGSLAVADARAGNAYSVFLSRSGHVFGCGSNEYGQMPFRSWVPKLIPLQRPGVESLIRMKAIGCCADMSVFLSARDEVFIRGGIPELGQLSGMNRLRKVEPFGGNGEFGGPHNPICHVKCGSATAFFIAQDGQIAGCGSNAEGQLQVSVGAVNTAPVAFMSTLCPVLPAAARTSALEGIDWGRHMAVGHGFALLLDRDEAYTLDEGLPPVVLPPPNAAPASGKRRLKF